MASWWSTKNTKRSVPAHKQRQSPSATLELRQVAVVSKPSGWSGSTGTRATALELEDGVRVEYVEYVEYRRPLLPSSPLCSPLYTISNIPAHPIDT
jgi:hypothetical protein